MCVVWGGPDDYSWCLLVVATCPRRRVLVVFCMLPDCLCTVFCTIIQLRLCPTACILLCVCLCSPVQALGRPLSTTDSAQICCYRTEYVLLQQGTFAGVGLSPGGRTQCFVIVHCSCPLNVLWEQQQAATMPFSCCRLHDGICAD